MGTAKRANEKVYIHEFVDIIAANRAKYMHHMTAVWAPVRREHEQECLGVWAEVGSTGNWPRVVNMWEHNGWDGLAFHLGYEASGKKSGQSVSLGKMEPEEAEWWARATEFRTGGRDRILTPAPWTRAVSDLIADGVRGAVYAHERIETTPGRSGDYLELLEEEGLDAYRNLGLEIVGAYQNALVNDRECIVIWAIPEWPDWAGFEKAWSSDPALQSFRRSGKGLVEQFERRLLTDNPLNPLLLGRQPHESDRLPLSAI